MSDRAVHGFQVRAPYRSTRCADSSILRTRRDVGQLLWSGQEEAYVPGEIICRVGVLQASTGREQEVVVFIEIVNGAEVKPRAVMPFNRISGLMEYFPGYREFVSEFALE